MKLNDFFDKQAVPRSSSKKVITVANEKKENELLDAISSILSNKERGDWSDPDFADIMALELIWDNEWSRLK